MKNLFLKSSLIVLLFSTSANSQNLVITPNQTPAQLVNTLVGVGVNATNISGQLSPISNGTFINNGVTGFTLSSGIILSSGEVSMITSPAASYFNSTDL